MAKKWDLPPPRGRFNLYNMVSVGTGAPLVFKNRKFKEGISPGTL